MAQTRRQPLAARLGKLGSGSMGMAEPGTTPHSLFVVVVVEVLALLWIRRQFRSAHGG